MREAVKRYSVAPYNVKYWELWNEPDVDPGLVAANSLFGCWGDSDDPYYGGGYYAEMLKEVYPAIKEADPEAQILVGGLLLNCDPTNPPDPPLPQDADCKPGKFLQGILENDGGDYFDLVAYHAYSYAFWSESPRGDWDLEHPYWSHRGGVTLGKADFLRDVMAQYGLQKALIVAEASLACSESNPACPENNFFDDQANHGIRLYTRAWANDLAGVIWFTLHFNNWRHADLLYPGDVPKPVYTSTHFLSDLLLGATYGGPLSSGTMEGYWFHKADSIYHLYWTNEPDITFPLSLPETPHVVYNKYGEEIAVDDESPIEIGFDPVIIEMGAICESYTLTSVGSGRWDNPATWIGNRVPSSHDIVWIQPNHTITAPPQFTVSALCNEGRLESELHDELSLLASDFVLNSRTGQIVGLNGSDGTGNDCGIPGSSVTIQPLESADEGDFGVAIINRGIIQGGNGGNAQQCAADGGSVYLLGRNSSNESTGYICAGKGGHLLDSQADGRAGKGGDTTMRGNFGGGGYLSNQGIVCSGDGGHASAQASTSQYGGDGGELIMVARPNIELRGGTHLAGIHGQGSQDELNGQDGDIWIAPDGIIDLSEANVEGGDITISAGYSWTIDLSAMNGSMISASSAMTLAVGTGGVIDLSNNDNVVLQARESVAIFSDKIRFDTTLTDVVSAPILVTNSARILRDVSIAAPEVTIARPGSMITIQLTILNNAPEEDSYDLTVTDSDNWTLNEFPTSISVEGLGSSSDNAQPLQLLVTSPDNASYGKTDTITIAVTSQSDPTVQSIQEIQVRVEFPIIYLPLVTRERTLSSGSGR
jgi:hypothetical protein